MMNENDVSRLKWENEVLKERLTNVRKNEESEEKLSSFFTAVAWWMVYIFLLTMVLRLADLAFYNMVFFWSRSEAHLASVVYLLVKVALYTIPTLTMIYIVLDIYSDEIRAFIRKHKLGAAKSVEEDEQHEAEDIALGLDEIPYDEFDDIGKIRHEIMKGFDWQKFVTKKFKTNQPRDENGRFAKKDKDTL